MNICRWILNGNKRDLLKYLNSSPSTVALNAVNTWSGDDGVFVFFSGITIFLPLLAQQQPQWQWWCISESVELENSWKSFSNALLRAPLPESTQPPAHSQCLISNSRFKVLVLGPWWPPFYLHQGHRFLFVISNSFSLWSAASSLAPVQLQSPQPQSQFWSRYQRKQLWSPCDSQFVYDRRWPKQILFSSNTIGKAPVWFVLSDHQKKRDKWKASDLIVWPHHPPRKRRDPARGVADKTRFITQSLCNKLEN